MNEAGMGAVTLCQDCGFAIQLRRVTSEVIGEFDSWQHFRVPITPHVGRPVICLGDHEFYGGDE